ncbi:hypothetical protein CMI47_02225 [Candidatus Pacearchaeota archaeon]|nr:hypothetical protein [Candidatus Pacearchaeota archaeon]|tara:strand:- start:5923 stop:6165 length:243 start_codon:yes stop_codon:yes gene_type:complete
MTRPYDNKPVRFRDIAPCNPTPPANLTPEKIEDFKRIVDEEMEHSGLAEQNRRTTESEQLTAEDYAVYINARAEDFWKGR